MNNGFGVAKAACRRHAHILSACIVTTFCVGMWTFDTVSLKLSLRICTADNWVSEAISGQHLERLCRVQIWPAHYLDRLQRGIFLQHRRSAARVSEVPLQRAIPAISDTARESRWPRRSQHASIAVLCMSLRTQSGGVLMQIVSKAEVPVRLNSPLFVQHREARQFEQQKDEQGCSRPNPESLIFFALCSAA